MSLKKFFTEEGRNALLARLKSLINLYEKGTTYPFQQKMFGFIPLSINSEKGHLHQINELRQIIGLEKVIVKKNDEYGRVTQIEVK